MKITVNLVNVLMVLAVLTGPACINPLIAVAAAKPAPTFHWTHYGGDPRRPGKPSGVHTKETFRAWFLSPAGQNDLKASGLPPKIQALMNQVVQGNQWGTRIDLGEGMYGSLQEHVKIPRGAHYDHLSWGRWGDHARNNVVVDFNDGYVFRVAVVDLWGGYWKVDTFERCANAGARAIVSYTPPAAPPEYVPTPGARPVPVPAPVYTTWYWDTSPMPKWEYKTATMGSYQVKGILPYVLAMVGQLYQPVARFSVSQTASPSFQGGSMNVGGATNTNINQNSATNGVVVPVNTVVNTGPGSATGTATGANNTGSGQFIQR